MAIDFQIVVYGKVFNHSGRDAWELFQSTGVKALVAYDCSGAILLMGTILGGLITGTCAGVWTRTKYPDQVIMVGCLFVLGAGARWKFAGFRLISFPMYRGFQRPPAPGVGSTIGAGVCILVGIVAREHSGPGLTLSFLITGIKAALSAFFYAEFSSRCPSAGSAYHYSYICLGEGISLLVNGTVFNVLANFVGLLVRVLVKWMRVLICKALHCFLAVHVNRNTTSAAFLEIVMHMLISALHPFVGRNVKRYFQPMFERAVCFKRCRWNEWEQPYVCNSF